MKKLLIMLLCIMFLSISCSTTMIANGKFYDKYGLVNKEEVKQPEMQYEVIPAHAVLSVLGVVAFPAGLLATAYFLGWDLWEPVGLK